MCAGTTLAVAIPRYTLWRTALMSDLELGRDDAGSLPLFDQVPLHDVDRPELAAKGLAHGLALGTAFWTLLGLALLAGSGCQPWPV